MRSPLSLFSSKLDKHSVLSATWHLSVEHVPKMGPFQAEKKCQDQGRIWKSGKEACAREQQHSPLSLAAFQLGSPPHADHKMGTRVVKPLPL